MVETEKRLSHEFKLSIVDRIYYYCSMQYNFVQRQKLSSPDPAATGFVVDLTAIVHVLDATMKQALHSRLNFIFDLYDLDGDGFLNEAELKAIMDAFLEMFQRSHDRAIKMRKEEEEEEVYMRAVSSFLTAALKMGNNKNEGAIEGQSKSAKPKASNVAFLLSFNEFLLAFLSQSDFVQYFERVWSVRYEEGKVSLTWTGKIQK